MPRNTYRSRQKRQTTQPSTLKANISSGPKPLQCDQCYFGTAYKSVMEMHKKSHVKTKPYECNQCLFSTAHEDEWQNHVKFHSISKLLGCRFCNYTTTQENELWAHELTHSTNKPLRCEQCDFTTAFQSVLDMHSKIHNSIPLFECNLCDFTTFVRAELINHKKIHPPGKPYKCIHCEYTSDRKSSVKLHQTVHSAIRQYKCNQCTFSSARKSNLTKHKFIHTNLKPHKCHHCKFASAYKGSLQLHIKTLHKGAKFFNCAQCAIILQRRPKAKDKVPSVKKPVKRQQPRKPKPVARAPKKVQHHIQHTVNQDSSQGTQGTHGHPGPELHMNQHHQVPETSKGHHHGLDLHMNHSMIPPPQGDLRDRGDFMLQGPRKPATPLRIPKVPQNEPNPIVCNPQRPVCTVSDCAAANNVNNNQAAYYANHMQSQQGVPYQIWHHGSNGISTWQCF